MKALKIEIVHDVVCSWCPIGYANVKRALHNLDIEANIRFLPSELNPDMGIKGEGIDDYLGRRYQWSQSKRREYRKNLLGVAEKAGVDIDFDKRTHYYNSNMAHRLILWSEGYNRQEDMNELLIDAYFKRGLDISNTHILIDLAEKLGLDREEAKKGLISSELFQQLLRRKTQVQKLELTSIPAFIFNEVKLVSGSNSVEYFEQVIQELTIH